VHVDPDADVGQNVGLQVRLWLWRLNCHIVTVASDHAKG
jgi:hypothetical protein